MPFQTKLTTYFCSHFCFLEILHALNILSVSSVTQCVFPSRKIAETFVLLLKMADLTSSHVILS